MWRGILKVLFLLAWAAAIWVVASYVTWLQLLWLLLVIIAPLIGVAIRVVNWFYRELDYADAEANLRHRQYVVPKARWPHRAR